MYPSTWIMVFLAYLTLKCVGTYDIDYACVTKKCRESVAGCLNDIANIFKFTLESPIFTNYHEEDLNFRQINSVQCAKNGIKLEFKPVPGDLKWDHVIENNYYDILTGNLDSTNILPKTKFCGYIEPINPEYDFNSQESKDCMDQLVNFPDDPQKAVDDAFMYSNAHYFDKKEEEEEEEDEVLEVSKNKPNYAAGYILHMIDEVLTNPNVDEPFVYCKNEFISKESNKKKEEEEEEEEYEESSSHYFD